MDRLVKPGGVHEPLHVGSEIYFRRSCRSKRRRGRSRTVVCWDGSSIFIFEGSRVYACSWKPVSFLEFTRTGLSNNPKTGRGFSPPYKECLFPKGNPKKCPRANNAPHIACPCRSPLPSRPRSSSASPFKPPISTPWHPRPRKPRHPKLDESRSSLGRRLPSSRFPLQSRRGGLRSGYTVNPRP